MRALLHCNTTKCATRVRHSCRWGTKIILTINFINAAGLPAYERKHSTNFAETENQFSVRRTVHKMKTAERKS